jgi:hypothetical protein
LQKSSQNRLLRLPLPLLRGQQLQQHLIPRNPLLLRLFRFKQNRQKNEWELE